MYRQYHTLQYIMILARDPSPWQDLQVAFLIMILQNDTMIIHLLDMIDPSLGEVLNPTTR